MTYSGTTEIRGNGVASSTSIDAWVRQMGRQLAPQYAPDHTYREPPPIGQAIHGFCSYVGVNSDLVAAQIVRESAGWQSAIARDKNNPSGLGAINDNAYEAAITFANPALGIHATIAHLLTYTEGHANPWWNDDPRAAAVPAQNLGAVRVLSDLDGRWAYPGQGYGQGIADLANQLVQFAEQQGGTMANRPSDIFGIPVTWIAAANGNWDNQRAGHDLVIAHDIEGGAPGAIGRFTTAGEQASTQLVLDPDNGRIVQMVDLDAVAYGCGNYYYNQRANQFEMPGYYGKPYRDDVLDYAAKTIAFLCKLDNIPCVRLSKEQVAAGQRGVCGHADIPNQSHIDPGPTFPWDQVMAQATALMNGGQPSQPDNPCRFFPETQHNLCLGFRAYWESYGDKALQTFGYPISEEFKNTDGLTVQYFERARFEWHPGSGQNPWDVLLGRLGDEVDEADRQLFPQAFAPVTP